jgi:hypothetical protein
MVISKRMFTDSIIWLEPPAQTTPILPLARLPILGCLLSECPDEEDNPIVEYVSLGAKS